MNKLLAHRTSLDRRLRLALREDLGRGDLTSRLVIPAEANGEAIIVAKQSGIAAGLPVVLEIFRLLDRRLKLKFKTEDGRQVQRGQVVALIEGSLRSILGGERVALNFLQHLSGVATETRKFVDRAKESRVKIFDTRKTTPLWRDLEKYAVRVGGGHNHRFSLGEAIMIKDTHWDVLKDKHHLLWRRKNNRRIFTTIEVHTMNQMEPALEARPHLILLDNWSSRKIRRAIDFADRWARGKNLKRPLIEASGGITLGNVRRMAASGVDRISVGSITHSARSVDFSLKVKPSA